MLKRISLIPNILMGSFLGVFLGRWLFQYIHYMTHPEYYASMSAPWYTGVLVYGGFTAIIILVCLILKLVVKLFEKRRNRK